MFIANLRESPLQRFDIPGGHFTQKKDAACFRDDFIGAFFDFNMIQRICRDSKLDFSYRYNLICMF